MTETRIVEKYKGCGIIEIVTRKLIFYMVPNFSYGSIFYAIEDARDEIDFEVDGVTP